MLSELLEIDGFSTRRVEALKEQGITSPEQVLELSEGDLSSLIELQTPEEASRLLQMVELYLERAIIIKTHVSLPNINKLIFFDLEASPFAGRELFLASFAAGEGDVVTFIRDEENMYSSINQYLRGCWQKTVLSSSGNNWDYRHLLKLLDSNVGYRKNALRQKSGMDLFSQLRKRVISPVGFSVKKLSHFLGFTQSEDVFSDPRVTPYLKKYRRYVKRGKSGYFMGAVYASGEYDDDFRAAMIDYNVSDVVALRYIYRKIHDIFSTERTGKIHVG